MFRLRRSRDTDVRDPEPMQLIGTRHHREIPSRAHEMSPESEPWDLGDHASRTFG